MTDSFDKGKDQAVDEANVPTPNLTKAEEERREFLKKCGKYAIYVSPIVVTLLLPNARAYAVPATAT